MLIQAPGPDLYRSGLHYRITILSRIYKEPHNFRICPFRSYMEYLFLISLTPAECFQGSVQGIENGTRPNQAKPGVYFYPVARGGPVSYSPG